MIAMTDDIMTRVREWLESCVRVATENGVPEEADLEAATLAHIDGEPARLAAAREEQREACIRLIEAFRTGEKYIQLTPEQRRLGLVGSINAQPSAATPLADEIASLRAEVVSLRAHQAAIEAALEPSSNIETTLGGRVKALRARVAELERQREGMLMGGVTTEARQQLARAEKAEARVAELEAELRHVTSEQKKARDADYAYYPETLRLADEKLEQKLRAEKAEAERDSLAESLRLANENVVKLAKAHAEMVEERDKKEREIQRLMNVVCSAPACTAGIVRRDDGSRVCTAGHSARWVNVDLLTKAEAELADEREVSQSLRTQLIAAEARVAELEAVESRIEHMRTWLNEWKRKHEHEEAEARVAQLGKDRKAAVHALAGVEIERDELRARLTTERLASEERLRESLDPIVRAKMLEAPPPIVIASERSDIVDDLRIMASTFKGAMSAWREALEWAAERYEKQQDKEG